MSTIAMKDLLNEMQKIDDDLIDILCGLLFLRLLLNRHKTMHKATEHFCDPAERSKYTAEVMELMKHFKND